ncbi:MAG TPA: phytoene/squalene synthase family protein [Candidatus Binatia bacterium]
MREELSAEIKAALDECRGIIRKGSKSFSLAARLFNPATRDAAFFLYGWCRYCDDQVDAVGPYETPDVLLDRVTVLKERTAAAFGFMPQNEPVFIALQYIAHRYAIPVHYALELIEGMAMDARATRYPMLKELLLYCYRVAGTVGLMMAHVMGVRDERALKHAADLGIAMQLTNIARDIIEDAGMGRVYIPLAWLREAQIEPDEIAAPQHREKLATVTLRLLHEAERYYRSGDEGLWQLSFRSACAVASARSVYSEIGRRLAVKGALAWDERTYVTGARKIWVVFGAVARLIRSVPARLFRPWSPAPLSIVWKASNVQ